MLAVYCAKAIAHIEICKLCKLCSKCSTLCFILRSFSRAKANIFKEKNFTST